MNSANSTTTSSIHLEDWEKQSYAKWIEQENKIKHLNKTLATLKDMQKTIECNLINAEEDVVKDPNQREQLIAHLKNKRNIKTTTELKLFDPPQSKQNQNS